MTRHREAVPQRPVPRSRFVRTFGPVVVAIGLAGFPAASARAASCNIITVPTLDFTSYDAFATTPLDVAPNLVYRCSKGQPVNITLDTGSSGSYWPRLMRQGAEVLRYNLFLDAGRSTVWGDGTGGTQSFTTTGVNGQMQTPIFGRVEPLQDALVGAYTDTVTVTFSF